MQTALVWLASLVCLVLVFLILRAIHIHKDGFIGLENSGHFIGAFLGVYLLPAVIFSLLCLILGKKPKSSIQVLLISCGAVTLSLLNLANALQAVPAATDPRIAGHVGALLRDPSGAHPAAPTVWDAAIRSFFLDLRAYNEQYLAAVSRTETNSEPLYSPGSFRDAATVRAMIAQLHARMAVADQYASMDPLIDKMKGYVRALDVGEKDKQDFLEGFESSFGKGVEARNVVVRNERNWINASLRLYEFALAKSDAYRLENGKLNFQGKPTAAEFNRLMDQARRLQAVFLQSYSERSMAQARVLSQLGLQPSDMATKPAP